MSDIEMLKTLMYQAATGGISALDLRRRVMQEGEQLSEVEFQSIILGLQEEDRLCGQEVDGQWIYTSIDKNDPGYTPLEYSPQFAEQIIAASCGEFREIDVDEMISQLDEMIAQARSRKNEK
ncbi:MULTISPECIES: hypothetical protein [Pseudomonas]|uniref:hypothetical protein n=1 Tax=Pseudomonas sp. TSRC2-2 TaxID=2804571 RepID=UPI003CE7C09F